MDRPANLGLSALWSKGLDEGEAIASVITLCFGKSWSGTLLFRPRPIACPWSVTEKIGSSIGGTVLAQGIFSSEYEKREVFKDN